MNLPIHVSICWSLLHIRKMNFSSSVIWMKFGAMCVSFENKFSLSAWLILHSIRKCLSSSRIWQEEHIQCKVKWDRRAPKPQYSWSFPQIFTLWQLWINICIFFQKFFWFFEQCPVQPLWVLGMRCLHLPVRALSKVLLLPVWVRLVLPSTAYSKGMLPLDLWCQASFQGLPERQHLGKTVHCSGWSDRIVSWVLGPWRRGWEICTEWGLVAQRLTTDSCPVVTGHIDPQRRPCWLPTTVVSAWEWAQGWRNLTVAHWQHVIFGDESRFQLYPVDGRLRVRRLPVERLRPGCQAHRVQAGGGSVHVWGAFYHSAKSSLVLPDGYLTGVLYRGILHNTLVPFVRHYFGDNYRYQDDNATPHRANVVLDFLQQGNVTKMEQPPRSPDCNPIKHLWDELGRAISSMDNTPQNLDELRQVLLDKWAQIPVQRLQCLVASMPRRLAAIIAARGGNTRYWPGTHKTRPPGSVTKKFIFVRPNLPQLSSSDIEVCTFGQLLILSSNVVKTDKTQQNKNIGHQIHRKHYITPNNLSLDLADWWNRNNHKKTHHPGV